MLYRNQNFTYKNHQLPYTLNFFNLSEEELTTQHFNLCIQELKNIINSEGGSSWLIQEIFTFCQQNQLSKDAHFKKLNLALIINMQIKIESFLQQQQHLKLTTAQKDWLHSTYLFHESTLHVWFQTITKKPYPWDIDPKYCNKDFQERLEHNVMFLQKVWNLILYLDLAIYENYEALQNKFKVSYDNIIDLFTIMFVKRLDHVFKECLVKYKEYSIPKSIEHTKAGILFLDKGEFGKLSPRQRESIIKKMNRHQPVTRPEIALIERVAYSRIKGGDKQCQKLADAMMRANQEYLKVDLKYRKRKKSSRNSDYYRSYTWCNGEKILATNGSYKISKSQNTG